MESPFKSGNRLGYENILALDVGEQIIGVALYLVGASSHLTNKNPDESRAESTVESADETGISLPLTPIVREKGSLALGPIKRLIKRYNPQVIVMGLPEFTKFSESPPSSYTTPARKHNLENLKKIKAYSKKLRRHLSKFDSNLKVVTLDEAYTTWVVKQEFPQIKKNNSALGVDSLAALEILKSFRQSEHS